MESPAPVPTASASFGSINLRHSHCIFPLPLRASQTQTLGRSSFHVQTLTYPLRRAKAITAPPDMSATKGPAPQKYDGSSLRVAIVHARWNQTIIGPLVQGAKEKLLECGVKETNIVTQTVPGSWELPTAVQRYASAARLQPPDRLPLIILTIAPSPTGSSRRRRSRVLAAGAPFRRATCSDPQRRTSRPSRPRHRPTGPLTPSSPWAC